MNPIPRGVKVKSGVNMPPPQPQTVLVYKQPPEMSMDARSLPLVTHYSTKGAILA